MEIKIRKKENKNLNETEMQITIEYSSEENATEFIKYIQEYDSKKAIIRQNNEFKTIDYKDILLFYSDKRDIYCKTEEGEFKIKNTLYELEKINEFLRISRSCIINVNHIKSFDILGPIFNKYWSLKVLSNIFFMLFSNIFAIFWFKLPYNTRIF